MLLLRSVGKGVLRPLGSPKTALFSWGIRRHEEEDMKKIHAWLLLALIREAQERLAASEKAVLMRKAVEELLAAE
jgi:hypothetical protein